MVTIRIEEWGDFFTCFNISVERHVLFDVKNLINTINYPHEIDVGIKEDLLYEENKLMEILRNESLKLLIILSRNERIM